MPEGSYSPSRSALVTKAEVRAITGYSAVRDVGDTELDTLIAFAQPIVVNKITRHVMALELEGDVDGSNTRFQIPRGEGSRIIVDDTLNQATDGSDVLIQSRVDGTTASDPATYATLTVASVDALNGVVTLSAAPATTIDAVLFTGRLAPRRFDLNLVKTCIAFKVGEMVDKRVREPGKVSLANPNAQRKEAGSIQVGRAWGELYREALRGLRHALPRSASVDTRINARAEAIKTDP